MANDEHDFLSALIEGIQEGFRGTSKKKGERSRPGLGATLMSAVAIIFVLGFVLGLIGAFIGFELTRFSRLGQDTDSGVIPGFLLGAGLGVFIGLIYVVRAWYRGNDL